MILEPFSERANFFAMICNRRVSAFSTSVRGKAEVSFEFRTRVRHVHRAKNYYRDRDADLLRLGHLQVHETP